jgi:hypothetical protein
MRAPIEPPRSGAPAGVCRPTRSAAQTTTEAGSVSRVGLMVSVRTEGCYEAASRIKPDSIMHHD